MDEDALQALAYQCELEHEEIEKEENEYKYYLQEGRYEPVTSC